MQNVSSQKRLQFGQKARWEGSPIPLYDAALHFKNHLAAVCLHGFSPKKLNEWSKTKECLYPAKFVILYLVIHDFLALMHNNT